MCVCVSVCVRVSMHMSSCCIVFHPVHSTRVQMIVRLNIDLSAVSVSKDVYL